MMQPIFPALFTTQNHVAAVRSDGTLLTGVAKPGDALSLFGNGFGPTTPSIVPGTVVQTAAPIKDSTTITIGGVTATVSFVGLSATGLYQFNVTVPSLPAGDHEVIATIASLRTQPGVLLKMQSS